MAEIGKHRTHELARTFMGEGLALDNDERATVEAWERLTHDVVDSKFDCMLSSAYNSATFDGLNLSVSDKYLSDDPSHAFDMPDLLGRGGGSHFVDWQFRQGYGWFDYADFESLLLDEEDFFEDQEFREEVQTRRRGSMFAKRAAQKRGGRPTNRAGGRTAPARSATRVTRPDVTFLQAAGLEPELAEALHDLPARDALREDSSFVSAYPRRMGRAGTTLLTRPQRNAGRMLSVTRPQRHTRLQQAAETLTRNERLAGASSGQTSIGNAPSWAPMSFDASFDLEAMPLLAAGETARRAGSATDHPSTAALATARALGRAGAFEAQAAVLAQAGIGRTQTLTAPRHASDSTGIGGSGPTGPGRTRIMLDGLSIAREQLPALSGAIDVAQAAFGDAAPKSPGARPTTTRMAGVFSPSRMDSALKIVTLGAQEPTADEAGPAWGYREMIYDAAEHTWLVPRDEGGTMFDAAAEGSSPARAGKTVSPRTATARMVARAMSTEQATHPLAARHIAGQATGTDTPGFGTAERVSSGQPTTIEAAARRAIAIQEARGGSVGPVVAPVADLAGMTAESFAREMTRFAPAARSGALGGLAAPGQATAGSAPQTSAQAFAGSQRSARNPVRNTSLETLIPAARHARLHRTKQLRALAASGDGLSTAGTQAAGLTAALASGGVSPELAGGTSGELGSAGRRNVTAAPFVSTVGRGVGVTSTAAELFAAAHLEDARGYGRTSLVSPMEAPVTVAGEVRYAYGSLAGAMDDPILYLQLPREEQQSALRQDPTPLVSAARKMSAAVAGNLSSVTMPLSSAARLQHALRTGPQSAPGIEILGTPGSQEAPRVGALTAPRAQMTPAQITAAGLSAAAPRRPTTMTSRFDATSDSILPSLGAFDASTVSSLAASLGDHSPNLLGSAASLMPMTAGEAALAAGLQAASGRMGAERRTVTRTADGIVSRMTTPRVGEGFAPGAASQTVSTPSAAAAEALRTYDGGGADEATFYQHSYDAETALLSLVSEGPSGALAGGHVEVRDGRIVRAVPATRAAERAMSVRAAKSAATAQSAGSATLAGLETSRAARLATQHTAQLQADGIRPSRSIPVMSGVSAAEAGFPALTLSGVDATRTQTTRVDAPIASPASIGVVATATEADFAMLPPMARAAFARQERAAVNMTGGGSDTAGLMQRLAAIADPSRPASRSALVRQLAALGVDTPELLRVLDETVSASDVTTDNLLTRDMSGSAAATRTRSDLSGPAAARVQLSAGGSAIDADTVARITRAEAMSAQLGQVVERLTGNPALAMSEISVDSDAYWGDFAPARIRSAGAADLLRSILGARAGSTGASRPSALAFGAELGELLAVNSATGGSGDSAVVQSLTRARRATAEGAPTKASHALRTERKAHRLAQRKASIAARSEALAAQAARPGQSVGQRAGMGPAGELPLAASSTTEQQVAGFMDRVAGAIAGSIKDGSTTTLSGDTAFGWDGDSMTLTAVADEGSLAGRVEASTAPWEAVTSRMMRGRSAAAAGGLPGMPGSSDPLSRTDNPLVRALTDSALDAPLVTPEQQAATLARSAARDAMLTGRAPMADGVRGFEAFTPGATRHLLNDLPSSRPVSGALGGSLDLLMSVVDRANGAFAGLDAGVLRFLSEASAGGGFEDSGRTIHPGMDDWDQTLEVLQAAGWGQGVQREGDSGTTAKEKRIVRLEKRLGAANEAYGRLRQSHSRTAGESLSMDAMDWNMVDTGAAREAPQNADLGRLGNTMIRPTSAPQTEMAMVAPAVKVVAQQAQLKPRSEQVASGGGGSQSPGRAARGKQPAKKKVNYEALASQIARRLQRRWALERDRFGRS